MPTATMPHESKFVSGSIAAFVAQYMPFMNDKDALVDAVTKKLMRRTVRCLSEDGWIMMMPGSNNSEDQTFTEVVKIAETVYQKAIECDRSLKDQRTTILECRSMEVNVPVTSQATKLSLGDHSRCSTRSIYYGKLNLNRDVSDAAFFAQFQPERTLNSIEENEDKIVTGSSFLLFDDPCRRFTFGFTIEDYSLRLWYFSRGHIAVSESVNFHQDPHHFVRFLLFVTFVPREALGYDSTVQRVKTIDEDISYLYKVGDDWYETFGKHPLYGSTPSLTVLASGR